MTKNFGYGTYTVACNVEEEQLKESIFFDEETGEIKILGDIELESYNTFRDIIRPIVDSMLMLQEEYRQPIVIYINSGGGNVLQGLNIINEIESAQEKGLQIHTIAGDCIASMALTIFMSGDVRTCNKFTEFMFHQIRGGGSSAELRHQEITMERANVYWDIIKDITKRCSKVDDAWIDKIYKEKIDYCFFGQEAIDLGFADHFTI